ncbi:cytosolic endo-beta-N-acetylglucosaminidase isoform X4 [Takifugu flavidus]|uniref:cytosolic endo-beta-N-acetylglucosaminidase isoform X4 n=1 Tax=Takifugu flavidus TaxID=433684 RepID=UPI0025441AF1|nr:cytosolic endo-beta-N-acetylglucosaminidase isoform X4 [Takifugu flavidus]
MALSLTKNKRRESDKGENEENVPAKREKRDDMRLGSHLDQPVDSNSIHEVIKYIPSPLPGKYYDPDTTEPVIFGLQTLEELLSWNEANPFNVAAVPLMPREPPLDGCKHRTLVSHDMMGGYLDDSTFSEIMVVCPEVHSRLLLLAPGTFITEWEDGSVACETFLKDEESYRAVADKLVQICYFYGFDGWLINIENTLSEIAVQNTPLFLRYLTDQMHQKVSGSLVLWYDSVTENGRLQWQNELNPSNRVFFSACDGFFTNYNWTEQSLESMRDYSEVQDRQADIYVGVDVFARGKVVGGMFDTKKALEVIRKYNFSAALFAPGWVYEALDRAEFRKNQDKFWALLSGYLDVHQLSSPLPFVSSFCQGFGSSFYCRGQREDKRSWFNLTAQEIQPLYYYEQQDGQGWLRSRGCPEDAWNGGSSLMLDGLIPAVCASPVCAKIFSLNVALLSKTLVRLIYKASDGITVSVELKTAPAGLCQRADNHAGKWTSVSPATLEDGHPLANQLAQLCGHFKPAGWTVRYAQLELQECSVLTELCINIQRKGEAADTPFICRVGEIMLLDVASLQIPTEQVQDLRIYDVVWLRGAGPSMEPVSSCLHLNATLQWKYPTKLIRHFKVYWRRLRGPDPRIPPGQLVLVGRAYSNLYRVTELVVPEPPSLIELVIEPVIRKGFLVPESQWGRRSLSYTEDTTQ